MREKTPTPFGEWAPDASKISGASRDIRGVLSKSGKYVPLPDLAPISSTPTLNDPCLGGGTFYSTTGEVASFVGDRGRLYRIVGGAPVDVSKSEGYSASPDWVWKFDQFGDNIVAVSRGFAPQRYILGSSAVFADLAGAPIGDTVFHIRQHLFICAGITVNASAFNNITDWTPDFATQAFQTTLNQSNGLILAGWGGEQGVIFQERGIYRVTYTGAGAPFIFDEVEGGRGLCSPHAFAVYGKLAFCAAEDGFYAFDGLQAQPIGANRVDQSFSESLGYLYRHKVWAAVDARRKSVMFAFPSGGSTVCNEVYIYNWADDRWTHDEITTQFGWEMQRSGLNIDDEAGIIARFGTANLDDAAFADVSVDSPIWGDNRKEWAIVDGTRSISQFTGASRAATLSTGTFEPFPGRKAFVSEVWPVTDAPAGSVTARVKTRLRRLDETETEGTASAMNEEGFCPAYSEGRYLSAEVAIAAGASWTEATGVLTDGSMSGER